MEAVREIYSRQESLLAILLRGEAPVLFSPGELLTLYQLSRLMRDHGGAYAEVGAFRGDSAEVVCRGKGDRRFYVFEAFDGLPSVGEIDERFARGMFASSETLLRKRLERFSNTTILAGYFPETAHVVEREAFSYVHLDLDLYEETKKALLFFYPRVLTGGRIIGHDYGQCEGVHRAFDEFFKDKPEQLEPTCMSQVMVIKCG